MKRTQQRRIIFVLVVTLVGFLLVIANSFSSRPSLTNSTAIALNYPYQSTSKQLIGRGAQAYWIFQPETRNLASAPVVLFLHGWLAMDPYHYGGWIDHIVRNGNIVIYPVYQTSGRERTSEVLENAIQATKSALNELQNSNNIKPDLSRFLILGHSLGGGLTAQVAAHAASAGLPTPKAIMPVQPGWGNSEVFDAGALSQIDPSVFILIVEGDQDQLQKTRQGKTIYSAANQVPASHKSYLVLTSNDPKLKVDHSAPGSPLESYSREKLTPQQRQRRAWIFSKLSGLPPSVTNAVDTNGFWPLFDALCKGSAGKSNSKTAAIDDILNGVKGQFAKHSGSGTPSNPAYFTIRP